MMNDLVMGTEHHKHPPSTPHHTEHTAPPARYIHANSQTHKQRAHNVDAVSAVAVRERSGKFLQR